MLMNEDVETNMAILNARVNAITAGRNYRDALLVPESSANESLIAQAEAALEAMQTILQACMRHGPARSRTSRCWKNTTALTASGERLRKRSWAFTSSITAPGTSSIWSRQKRSFTMRIPRFRQRWGMRPLNWILFWKRAGRGADQNREQREGNFFAIMPLWWLLPSVFWSWRLR